MALAVAHNGTHMSPAPVNVHQFFEAGLRRNKVNTSQASDSIPDIKHLPSEAKNDDFQDKQQDAALLPIRRPETPPESITKKREGQALGQEEDKQSTKVPSAVLIGLCKTPETQEPRYKRRKMTPEQKTIHVARQSMLTWVQPPTARCIDIETKQQKEESDIPSPIVAGDTTGASEAKNGLQSNPPPPAKKLMKLRTDGRLFSPPKKPVVTEDVVKGRKTGKSKRQRLVVFRYGTDEALRVEIGNKIDQIMKGESRIRPSPTQSHPKPVPIKITSATPTRKSTHPFFLGPQKPGHDNGQSSLPQRTVISMSRNTSTQSHASEMKFSAAPMFGASNSRMVVHPDSTESPWPPIDMVHVQAAMSPDTASTIQSSLLTNERKSKGSQVKIEAHEDVLYRLEKLAFNLKLNDQEEEDILSFPALKRLILPRAELQSRLRTQLGTKEWTGRAPINPSQPSTKQQLLPQASQRLFETLPSTRSAFDNFKCENQEWIVKYSPRSALDILQPQHSMLLLRDWLAGTAVHSTTVSTLSGKDKKKRKQSKRRKRNSELDDFIITSEDEYTDDSDHDNPLQPTDRRRYHFNKTTLFPQPSSTYRRLNRETMAQTRAVIISGPHGCGKTAAVQAIATELELEIFEINPGSRRSGKDILERVGDMTKNHLVNQGPVPSGDEHSGDERPDTEEIQEEIASGKQSTMQAFFQSKPPVKSMQSKTTKPSKPSQSKAGTERVSAKPTRSQKQSLILLEEVDVLFEEDKQFWSTISSIISTSRRPVIMTCNDESLIPAEELEDCALLRLGAVEPEEAIDHLLLIAAHEGHLLQREAVEAFYFRTNFDLRASIMQLNFWCQMALNDPKGGLKWMLFPQDYQGTGIQISELRVLSQDTCLAFTGMIGRNQSRFATVADSSIETIHQAMTDWNLDETALVDDQLPCSDASGIADGPHRHLLEMEACYDALSVGDILDSSMNRSLVHDNIRALQPFSDQRRSLSFTSGYPLICDPFEGIVQKHQPWERHALIYYATNILCKDGDHEGAASVHNKLSRCVLCQVEPLSKHHGLVQEILNLAMGAILPEAEMMEAAFVDLAPYIRSIVSYDVRLEKERTRLNDLLFDGNRQGKRQRTTRASRAALEGGHKGSTRREKWFDFELDPVMVQETGGEAWQRVAWEYYEKALQKSRWVQQAEESESEDELAR